MQGAQLVLVGQRLQLKDQCQGQARLQIRQLDGQLPRRRVSRQQQAPTRIAQAVEQMKQRLLPIRPTGHCLQIIQTDQLALLQVVQQFRAVIRQFGQGQIDRLLAALLETQAGRLQQMAATDARAAP